MNHSLRRFLSSAFKLAAISALSGGLVNVSYAQTTKIRVGATVSSDVSAAAFCLAMKNGAFKKAGLDIELRTFVQSGQKYDAFKGDAIDIDINMGAINAAQLFSSGVPMNVLRAVTPADIWAVVAKADSPLSKPADFKGKRFGVVSLSGTNFGVTYFSFKTQNIDFMREVKVSTLPPSALVASLEKGEIDGATLYEPYLTSTLKTGKIKVLFKPGEVYEKRYGEPFIALVISGRKDFIEKNRAATAKFVKVMEDTLNSLSSNVDAASQALVEEMPDIKMTAADAKELIVPYLPNVIRTPNDPAFLKKAQNFYDRLGEAKQLKQPVKVSDFWVKL